MISPARRQFLTKTSLVSVGFVLFNRLPSTCWFESMEMQSDETIQQVPDDSQVDAWLQIDRNGTVKILTGRMELGQGVKVVMQQVAGEELNLEPHTIQIVVADTGLTPNEGYTSGSQSVERGAMSVRRAAATAREIIIEMAAKHWQTATSEIIMQDGNVLRKDATDKIPYQVLLEGKQISASIRNDVRLKAKEQYRWVGQPYPHPDMPSIVRGDALYVQDLRLPGMLHARVLRPPVYNAELLSWNHKVEEMPGVLRVVENGSFLAVITEKEFQAVTALQALREGSKWKENEVLPEVQNWSQWMLTQKDALPPNVGTHEAVYSKPYTMHGSIGPSCAVARYDGRQLHIWSHTQGVYPLRSTIADLTGLEPEDIRITGVQGSGCYGHNGADDAAADAAILAIAHPNHPIRVQFQREDEHQWEPYGSAMRMQLSATLEKEKINKWNYQLWSDSHSTRPRGKAGHLLAGRHLKTPFEFDRPQGVGGGTRNSEPYYDIPQTEIVDHFVQGPLRTSALRSLGAYANIFAMESFVEELAEIAGIHPLEFRIRHLKDERAIQVIRVLRDAIEAEKNQTGTGIGFGFSRYKNTAAYCAVATRLQVDLENKSVMLLKMWAVLDAGEAINIDGLKNQTAGGMIQSASWTLREEVQFNPHEVTSRDWTQYPILRYHEIPQTEVIIINHPELPPLGAGEAAQGPAAASIANAIYSACGKRVRDLPIEKTLFL